MSDLTPRVVRKISKCDHGGRDKKIMDVKEKNETISKLVYKQVGVTRQDSHEWLRHVTIKPNEAFIKHTITLMIPFCIERKILEREESRKKYFDTRKRNIYSKIVKPLCSHSSNLMDSRDNLRF